MGLLLKPPAIPGSITLCLQLLTQLSIHTVEVLSSPHFSNLFVRSHRTLPKVFCYLDFARLDQQIQLNIFT